MDCVFSVDVEDWFHILDLPTTPDFERWGSLPSHVERNFRDLLDIISEKNRRVTCFFLGWIAEKFPHLLREAAARGHEIASHGYSHQLVYNMSPEAFLEDIRKSKRIIEDAVGRAVLGYRSPGFSVTEATPWFFAKVAEAGYRYDSSVFPAPRNHGGLRSRQYAPYVVHSDAGSVVEFPITVTEVLGRPMCFFGGGYLRLFPYRLTRTMGRRVVGEQRPVVFYVHPREIDPRHPRLPMNAVRRFKSYVGLKGARQKVSRILEDFPVTTFEDYLARNRVSGGRRC